VRPSVARVCGTFVVLLAGLQAPSSALPGRDARIAFQTENGVLRLEVFTDPGAFVVDPHALRFSLRPYRGFQVDPNAAPLPIHVDVGTPVARPNAATRPAYLVPIAVAAPPRPGMYELSADALPGFARTTNGEEIPVSRFPSAGIGAIAAWWPDESNGDAGLRDVRARFSQRTVHGFGGVPFICPTWGTRVGPETAVQIGTVTRETGHAEVLRTGLTWGGDVAFSFLAFDPLALHVTGGAPAPPDVPNLHLQPCDVVLRYADPWHVDTSLSTAAPPRIDSADGFAIRPGMSRDDVVWRMGYPNSYGTVASFRAEDRWEYVSPTPFSWSVTFARDRVVDVHPPGRLPG
jgi:hypothetical protein